MVPSAGAGALGVRAGAGGSRAVRDVARVLVVDDHPVVADGVRLLLGRSAAMTVAGSAQTARQALALARDLRPDLVLLDLRLPDADPPELVGALRRAAPGVKVVLFTAHPDGAVLQATLAAGVEGCLLKDAGTGDLPGALEHVLAGGRSLDPRLEAGAGPGLHERLSRVGLTRREHDVLRLVATGLTNPEIAAQLHLSRNTVKSYLQGAMQKLGARNRVEVITRGHEVRLL